VLSFELLTLIEFSTTAIAFPATALFMVGSSFLVYMQTDQEIRAHRAAPYVLPTADVFSVLLPIRRRRSKCERSLFVETNE
jgi:hypothetical protein